METPYDHLTQKRCRDTKTGEGVWVLGLMQNPVTGKILALLSEPRGAMIPADRLEVA